MDKVLGNFLTQGNRDFPLDCETLETLQDNQALLAVLGNIAGDKVILYGCELSQDQASRSEGYVFLRTQACPTGEILRFEGGAVSGGMYLKKEDIAVSAQGYDYPKAYTKRTLVAGVGEENYSWSDFTEVSTNKALNQALSELRSYVDNQIARLAPAPLGVIQMWAGSTVPDNYKLCNGQALSKETYPELYAAIGDTFNTAPAANGSNYAAPANGQFRLPDLQGRFIVGQSATDPDYLSKGKAAGEKKHTLTTAEMPTHAHSTKDYYTASRNNNKNRVGTFDELNRNSWIGPNDTDKDNSIYHYIVHDTYDAGNGGSHENRPPYYVLAYIIRVK